jgi:hypothetical protein
MERTKKLKPVRTKYKYIGEIVENPLIPDDIKNIDHPDFIEKFMGATYFDDEGDLVENKNIKFRDSFVRSVYYLAKHGFTDGQMADFFGVNYRTFSGWKARYPEFTTTVLQGRGIYNLAVVEGLHKSTNGYSVTEVDRTVTTNPEGTTISERQYTKYIPGNQVAQIFWLKNRMPDQWADTNKTEIKTDINVTNKLDMSMFNDEERQLIKSIGIKKLAQSHGVSTK